MVPLCPQIQGVETIGLFPVVFEFYQCDSNSESCDISLSCEYDMDAKDIKITIKSKSNDAQELVVEFIEILESIVPKDNDSFIFIESSSQFFV